MWLKLALNRHHAKLVFMAEKFCKWWEKKINIENMTFLLKMVISRQWFLMTFAAFFSRKKEKNTKIFHIKCGQTSDFKVSHELLRDIEINPRLRLFRSTAEKSQWALHFLMKWRAYLLGIDPSLNIKCEILSSLYDIKHNTHKKAQHTEQKRNNVRFEPQIWKWTIDSKSRRGERAVMSTGFLNKTINNRAIWLDMPIKIRSFINR